MSAIIEAKQLTSDKIFYIIILFTDILRREDFCLWQPWCCWYWDHEVLENESEGKVLNYHFKENYKGDKLSFDYKLRRGVSDTETPFSS